MNSWLQERRLRPIYELLDGGNNKKVVTEVDRLLKKQGSFPCAKVLKALALIRMNKPDEAKAILKPVAEQAPTDDATIQALSICYREVDEPGLLADVLEAACEKEKSEELLTHCFMAQVRVLDYKKMYTTAMQLYKSYNKSTYYGWAVASLVLKYDLFIGPLEKTDYVSLELASRMMDKHVTAMNNIIEDNMLDLQLGILSRQAAWEKMLVALKNAGYPKTKNWKSDTFHTFYTLALTRLERFEDLFEYLKTAYIQNQEEYGLLKEIIDMFGIEGHDPGKTKALMDDVVENHPSLTVFLADLYYTKHCVDSQTRTSRYTRSLNRILEYDIEKPSFYPDIIDYFRELPSEEQQKYVASICPKPGPEGTNYDTIQNILKDSNYETMNRLILNADADNVDRLKQAEICFGKYLICDGFSTSLRSPENIRTKEPDFHDQFLTISALYIMEDYHKSPLLASNDSAEAYLTRHPWTALDHPNCPPELHKLKETLQKQKKENTSKEIDGLIQVTNNMKISDNGDCEIKFNSRELVLLFGISILEFGLSRSPYNYTMRILLSKAYGHLGAINQATKVIHGLDLKHVQWDSLGYLIFPQALTAGVYPEVSKMLASAETMYSTYKRESMEHVISAFKYGSFLKVREFISFKSELLQSIQCAQSVIEKKLLEFMLSTGSSQDLLKIAESSSRDSLVNGLLEETNTADNRDFSVLQYFEESVELKLAQETTGNLTTRQNKLRSAFLVTIEKLVLFSRAGEEKENLVTSIDKYAECCHQLTEKTSSVANGEVSCPQLHGFWPHRFSQPLATNAASLLADQLNIVKSLVLNDEKFSVLDLQTVIEKCSKTLLDCVTSHKIQFSEDMQTINMDRCIYDLHIALETFSFTRIVAECAINILKMRHDGVKSKSKQKDKTNQMQLLKKGFQGLAKQLLENLKVFTDSVGGFIDVLNKRKLLKLCLLSSSIKNVLNESFLSHAFTSHFDTAQLKIRESQLTQLEELRRNAACLLDYIRVNLEPSGK